jgi:hypothetical protein
MGAVWLRDGSGRRSSGARTLINLVILVLAVIGAVAILGWVLSTVLWLLRLAAVVIAAAVAVALLKVAVRARGNRG